MFIRAGVGGPVNISVMEPAVVHAGNNDEFCVFGAFRAAESLKGAGWAGAGGVSVDSINKAIIILRRGG